VADRVCHALTEARTVHSRAAVIERLAYLDRNQATHPRDVDHDAIRTALEGAVKVLDRFARPGKRVYQPPLTTSNEPKEPAR